MSLLNNELNTRLLDTETNKADTAAYLNKSHVVVCLPDYTIPEGAVFVKSTDCTEYRLIKDDMTHFKAVMKRPSAILIIPFALTEMVVWWDERQPLESPGWRMASTFFHFNMSGIAHTQPSCDNAYWLNQVDTALANDLAVYTPVNESHGKQYYRRVYSCKTYHAWLSRYQKHTRVAVRPVGLVGLLKSWLGKCRALFLYNM